MATISNVFGSLGGISGGIAQSNVMQQYSNLISSSFDPVQFLQLQQAHPWQTTTWSDTVGTTPAMHFGQVRQMRKKFKEISKEDFRKISNKPVVKEILSGLTKLNGEEIADRIKEHITD